MKILIVEDEIQLCESLKELLKNENYDVEFVHDGLSGVNFIMSNKYDVIILDIMLPDMDGIEVMTHVRSEGVTTPILLLTAKSNTTDKIKGLDKGADDYLTKPFNPGELLARLRALHRRNPYVIKREGTIITFSNITLNKSTIKLYSQNKEVFLTHKEFELMELFISNPHHVFTKDAIISEIWSFDDDVMYNTLEAHISSLRKKMKYIRSKPRIVTVRGLGYKLEG